MICPCPCHEFTPESQGCFNCELIHTSWPKPKSTVTAQNLHAVVSYIESTPEPAYDATRFTLHFVPPPATYTSADAPPSPAFTQYAVLVANGALAHGNLTAKDILAQQINNDLHAGKLPAYLFDLLKSSSQLTASDPMWFANDPTPVVHGPPPPNGQTVVTTLRSYIPGVDTVVKCPADRLPAACPDCIVARVECPHGYPAVACARESPIHDMVQHLNDQTHRWSREQIADWLEALDVDLSFQDEPVTPPPLRQVLPSVNEMIKEIYAPQVLQYQQDAIEQFYAFVMKPQAPSLVVHPKTYEQIKKHVGWAPDHVEFQLANSLKGEWLDDDGPNVDTHPLAAKAKKHVKPPSYSKFLFNPTKSKKIKEH